MNIISLTEIGDEKFLAYNCGFTVLNSLENIYIYIYIKNYYLSDSVLEHIKTIFLVKMFSSLLIRG